ncbi:MAG: hypothetical protein ACK4XJ_10085 [Fimbriimonadaceae bacterium]
MTCRPIRTVILGIAVAMSIGSVTLLASGCRANVDSESQSAPDRTQDLMDKSAGRWENLTEEERSELIQALAPGDEAGAQIQFRRLAEQMGY